QPGGREPAGRDGGHRQHGRPDDPPDGRGRARRAGRRRRPGPDPRLRRHPSEQPRRAGRTLRRDHALPAGHPAHPPRPHQPPARRPDTARAGQVIVDPSTAHPASTRTLHDELRARGVRYLDAGISGGAAGAEKGTLTLMVGGDETALAQVKPLLDTFSAHVHHMGGSGAGHVTKVLNNFLNGVTLAATAEVMVAGKKAGLDLAQLLAGISTSTGVSFASLNRFPHIIKGDYLEGGLTGRLMAKDVRLYLDLAEDLGVVTLVGPGTLAAFQVSNALGYGTMISNRVVDAVGDLAGGIRVPEQGHEQEQED